MESLGDTLKNTRKERDLSIEHVAHEINISRNHLEALEEENFDVFPAEIYLIGFLRNYAQFLGLNADQLIRQFYNYKLSEEPTPIKQLIGPIRGATIQKFLPWIFITLALGSVAFFGLPRLFNAPIKEKEDIETNISLSQELRLTTPLWGGQVAPGDILLLENGNDSTQLLINGDEKNLNFSDGNSLSWSLALGEEFYLPNSAGQPTWRLYLKDLGLSNGGGILEVEQISEILPPFDTAEEIFDEEPPSGTLGRQRASQIIQSASSAEPFVLEASFHNFSLFRYKIDAADTQETYYADGDTFRLNVRRRVTLWASNAGTVSLTANNQTLSLGRQGEVVVGRILWILNRDSGLYDLTLQPLY